MPTLIQPTTSAVTASSATEFQVGQRPVTLSADSLAGSEEVDIQYSGNGGRTWQTLQDDVGAITLTATRGQIYIEGPGKYRVAKDATASACGVDYTY